MNKLASWTFYVLLVVYALYNALWMIGTTFSWGKSDAYSELIFLFLTFILDIPIFWFINKNLKIGLSLLAITLACSLALAHSLSILSWFSYSFWYSPKILIAAVAMWSNLSHRKEKGL